MLLKNLFVYDEVQNPQVLLNSLPLFIVLMALYKSAILACCVSITLNKNIPRVLAFACWMTASLLLSPNGSSYSLVLLLIPTLALANGKPVYVYTGMALVFLINNIPVQALAKWPLVLQYPTVVFTSFVLCFDIACRRYSFSIEARPVIFYLAVTGRCTEITCAEMITVRIC